MSLIEFFENAPLTLAVCGGVFVVSMFWAAISDLLKMQIPNVLTYCLAGAFFIAAFVLGLPITTVGWHLLAGVGTLLAGFTLFAFGWMGGGDVKLAVSCALWLGLTSLLEFFVYFSLAGGVLAFLFLSLRMFPQPQVVARIPWMARLLQPDGGIPYGIAIAAGALIAWPTSALSQFSTL